jgi:VanZ family protein
VLPLVHVLAWRLASVALVGVVTFLSLAPMPAELPLPTHADKLEHLLAYVGLALWFAGLYPRERYAWIAAGLAGYGLTIELLQHSMAVGRYGDPWDFVADVLGIALGLTIAGRGLGGWAARMESWATGS